MGYKDLKKNGIRKDFTLSLMVKQAPILLLCITAAILLNFKTYIKNGGLLGPY